MAAEGTRIVPSQQAGSSNRLTLANWAALRASPTPCWEGERVSTEHMLREHTMLCLQAVPAADAQ